MKIYKSEEWVINLGIVGFDRIMNFAQNNLEVNLGKDRYKIHNDSIEFDVNILENFSHYYFEYFLDRYNSGKDQSRKLEYLYSKCLKGEKFKDNIKYLKELVKKNNDKIKKIDETVFERCTDIYKELGKIKTTEEMINYKNIINEYSEFIQRDSINRIITMNKFKSILSNNFFGQSSFMNVVNSSKSIDEQKEIIQKDYVDIIINIERLNEIDINEGEEELKKYINNESKKNISKNTEKLMKKINNELFRKKRKSKNLEDVIKSFPSCAICGEEISIDDDYTEGNFIPLAVSSVNSQNMFWNLNAKYPIGGLCKLLLLCTAAGATELFKNYLDDKYDYKDKIYYGFINLEDKLRELIRINNDFSNKTDKEISFETFILDSISQTEKICKWQLQNILYVEFNADYGAKSCILNYFNIPDYLARLIINEKKVITSIKNSKTRFEVFDMLVARKDLNKLIDRKLRSQNRNPIEIYQIILISHYLRIYKGGEVMENKDYNKQLNFIYVHGINISKKIIRNKQKNKIQGIVYKLLNAAKANNRSDFMDIILRIHLTYEEQVPSLFLDVLKEEKLSFNEIAHSFITGLLVNEDKEEEKNNE